MSIKNFTYYGYAAVAYLRGIFGMRYVIHAPGPTCTTGLNLPGEARAMFVKHGWTPWCYRRTSAGWSRTFLTGEDA